MATMKIPLPSTTSRTKPPPISSPRPYMTAPLTPIKAGFSTPTTKRSCLRATNFTRWIRRVLPLTSMRRPSSGISPLEKPILSGTWKSDAIAIDHNQYVKNFFFVPIQLRFCLRIIDVSSIPSDPTGAGVKEVAFLDIFPEDDNITDAPEFLGSWHNYPYFNSGHIVLDTYDKGAFVVKRSKKITGGVRAQS